MDTLGFLLNLPWTIIGLFFGVLSIPRSMKFQSNAIIITVHTFWWQFWYLKGIRAANIGHVVMLGSKPDPRDLTHELVHVKQYIRYPFVYPFLYYYELFTKGYRNNRFEDEAYKRAGNFYGKLD